LIRFGKRQLAFELTFTELLSALILRAIELWTRQATMAILWVAALGANR